MFYSSSLRYSIYKVHPFAHANFDMIPRINPFVKTFFIFFKRFFHAVFYKALSRALAYTSRYHAKCQYLFLLFYDFFLWPVNCVSESALTPKYTRAFPLPCAIVTTALLLFAPILRMQPSIAKLILYQAFTQQFGLKQDQISYPQALLFP